MQEAATLTWNPLIANSAIAGPTAVPPTTDDDITHPMASLFGKLTRLPWFAKPVADDDDGDDAPQVLRKAVDAQRSADYWEWLADGCVAAASKSKTNIYFWANIVYRAYGGRAHRGVRQFSSSTAREPIADLVRHRATTATLPPQPSPSVSAFFRTLQSPTRSLS
jgi:hypothetical protein